MKWGNWFSNASHHTGSKLQQPRSCCVFCLDFPLIFNAGLKAMLLEGFLLVPFNIWYELTCQWKSCSLNGAAD